MRYLHRPIFYLFILISVFAFGSCQKAADDDGSNPQTQKVKVEVEGQLTNLLLSKRNPSSSLMLSKNSPSSSLMVNAIQANVTSRPFLGTMVIKDAAGQHVEGSPFAVNVTVDPASLAASFDRSFTVFPGTYSFDLSVTKDNQNYVGGNDYTVEEDGVHRFSMAIHPRLGNASGEMPVVSRLSSGEFKIPSIQLARFTAPEISVWTQDETQTELEFRGTFAVNKTTGIMESLVDLPTGAIYIHLEFSDNGMQLGKSKVEQEYFPNYKAGDPITLSFYPLEGKVSPGLSVQGGPAPIDLALPDEVIAEAGGIDNLLVKFTLLKNNSPVSTDQDKPQGSSGNYSVSVSLPEVYFGTYDLLVEFIDIVKEETLGQCKVENREWSSDTQEFNCSVELRRAGIITSDLMASVMVYVTDSAGNSLSNALITTKGENGQQVDLATTGAGDFLNSGTGHFYSKPGTVELTAYHEISLAVKPIALIL